MLPVGLGGLDQQCKLFAGKRQHVGLFEQLAVEAQYVHGQYSGKSTAVHVAPQLGQHAHRYIGLVHVFDQQLAKALVRQQLHVFGKHGEQAAHQELRHDLRRVAVLFQAARQGGKSRGNFAGYARGLAARVQRQRLQPDLAQALANFGLAQFGQRESMAAWVGEGRVGCAGARKFRVQLDAVTHIHHYQEGWSPLVGGKRARIPFRLAACAQQRIVEALGVRGRLDLFRLKHERATPIQIDAPGTAAAIAMAEGNRPLEHVVLFGRGVWHLHAQQRAQVDQEALRGGKFGSDHALPFGDEGVGGGVFGVGHGPSSISPGSSIAASTPRARYCRPQVRPVVSLTKPALSSTPSVLRAVGSLISSNFFTRLTSM